ncbi:MAG: hypothetical protein J6P05_00845 [Lachnospiraceae bacterium]|nr:hypothetical protein [Lachnospiraceae bacterium]
MPLIDTLKKIFTGRHRHLPGMDGRFFCIETCDGCGECYRRCPTGHIKMENGKPVWKGICLMCASCANVCPIDAIRFGSAKDEEQARAGKERIDEHIV